MRRPPITLLLIILLAATAVLVPAGANARTRCNPKPKPPSAVPLGAIDLLDQSVNPSDPSVTVSPLDYGDTISFIIPSASSPLAYGFSVPLAANQKLEVLPTGDAAVTETLPPAPNIGGGNTNDLNANESVTLPPPSADDASAMPDNDDTDSTDYPGGDAVAPDRDGMTIVDDTLSQLTGDVAVVAAFDSPVATDAAGQAVPVSLKKGSNALVISISPQYSTGYPITVSLPVGFNIDYTSTESDQPLVGRSLARLHLRSMLTRSMQKARASVSCSGYRAQIVVSYVSHVDLLTRAFSYNPGECVTYDISVPPHTYRGTPGIAPNPMHSAATISALSKRSEVVRANATFVPVAEVNWGLISDYLTRRNQNSPSNYFNAGRSYAQLMKPRGYSIWSIDEAPCSLLSDQTRITWSEFIQLAHGIQSVARAKGIIFNCYQPQDSTLDAARSIKTGLKTLLQQQAGRTNFDWQSLSTYTSLWANESYTLCSKVCVGGSLKSMAQHTNAYMQYQARLAFAKDVPDGVAPAQSFLQSRFTNLVNAWANTYPAYGTAGLTSDKLQRLAHLQVYAARAWENSPDHTYSGPRLGVRWTDNIDLRWTSAQKNDLAAGVAHAIANAYGLNGTPLGACNPAPAGVKTSVCQPQAIGASPTKVWSIFAWWSHPPVTRPANDDFANAQVIEGERGTADGTINGATVETSKGEWTGPDGDITKSVWYKWTAPIDERVSFAANEKAAQPAGDLQLFVFTGDALGHLTPIFTWSAWNPNSRFLATGGNTYYIEVANSPSHLNPGDADATDFTLYWDDRYYD